MLFQLCSSQDWCWQKQLQSIIPLFTLNKTLPILSQLPPFWGEGETRPAISVWHFSLRELLLLPWYLQINIQKWCFLVFVCFGCFWQNRHVRLFSPRTMIDLLTAFSVMYRTYVLRLKAWKLHKVKVEVKSTVDIFCINNKLLCIKILPL